MTDPARDESHQHDGDHGHHVHVTPFWTMTIVFVALLVLTVVTVLTAKFVDLPGNGNLILALFLAGLKGLLVAGFFMHLVYDNAMNTIVSVSTMFAVILFFALTLIDLGTRGMHDTIESGEIVAGGGAPGPRPEPTEDNPNPKRPKIGNYGAFWTDAPGMSIVDQARAAKKHDAAAGGDDGDDASGDGDDAAAADEPADAASAQEQGADEADH